MGAGERKKISAFLLEYANENDIKITPELAEGFSWIGLEHSDDFLKAMGGTFDENRKLIPSENQTEKQKATMEVYTKARVAFYKPDIGEIPNAQRGEVMELKQKDNTKYINL